ncbi:MAG: ankyrin repeat domain-containing protein [Desulfobacterales bacterium]|nr:ankyrin repeat domain-containing protein [Desulfobacterales bacterium]
MKIKFYFIKWILFLFYFLAQYSVYAEVSSEKGILERIKNEMGVAIGNQDAGKISEILKIAPQLANGKFDDGTPYIMAVLGSPDILKIFIDNGADPNSKVQEVPLLYNTIGTGNIEGSKILLNAGADPNAIEPSGASPIFTAIAQNHLNLVKLLIENGADLKQPYKDRTPLQFAREKGKNEIAEFLQNCPVKKIPKKIEPVNKKVESEQKKVKEASPEPELNLTGDIANKIISEEFYAALSEPNLEKVKTLLEKGADPDAPLQGENEQDRSIYRPIHYVLQSGGIIFSGKQHERKNPDRIREVWEEREKIIFSLLDYSADTRHQVFFHAGYVPLFYRAIDEAFERPDILRALLSSGAPCTRIVNEDGPISCLRFFIRKWGASGFDSPGQLAEYKEILQMIISNGGDVDESFPPENPVLFELTNSEFSPAIVEAIIDVFSDKGANFNLPSNDSSKHTVLHIAVNDPKLYFLAKLLLDSKADPNSLDSHGNTPLLNMAKGFYSLKETETLMSLLIKKGAKVNIDIPEYPGQTPLHHCNSKSNLFSILQSKGGKCFVKNENNETPCNSCNNLLKGKGNATENKQPGNLKLKVKAEPLTLWANLLAPSDKMVKGKGASRVQIEITDEKGKPAGQTMISVSLDSNEKGGFARPIMTTDSSGIVDQEYQPFLHGQNIMKVSIRNPDISDEKVKSKGKTDSSSNYETIMFEQGELRIEEVEKPDPVPQHLTGGEIFFRAVFYSPNLIISPEGREISLIKEFTDGNISGSFIPETAKTDINGTAMFAFVPGENNTKGINFKVSAKTKCPDASEYDIGSNWLKIGREPGVFRLEFKAVQVIDSLECRDWIMGKPAILSAKLVWFDPLVEAVEAEVIFNFKGKALKTIPSFTFIKKTTYEERRQHKDTAWVKFIPDTIGANLIECEVKPKKAVSPKKFDVKLLSKMKERRSVRVFSLKKPLRIHFMPIAVGSWKGKTVWDQASFDAFRTKQMQFLRGIIPLPPELIIDSSTGNEMMIPIADLGEKMVGVDNKLLKQYLEIPILKVLARLDAYQQEKLGDYIVGIVPKDFFVNSPSEGTEGLTDISKSSYGTLIIDSAKASILIHELTHLFGQKEHSTPPDAERGVFISDEAPDGWDARETDVSKKGGTYPGDYMDATPGDPDFTWVSRHIYNFLLDFFRNREMVVEETPEPIGPLTPQRSPHKLGEPAR